MLSFSEIIDAVIEPFAPRMVNQRMAWRRANEYVRKYDGAKPVRDGRHRSGSSANAEVLTGIAGLRNAARELVRNNRLAATAIRQMTNHIVGNGMSITMHHDDDKIADAAQEAWDEWAESRVDGRNDFYGVQKLVCRAWLTDGDVLCAWSSRKGYSDRVRVFEGDLLDHNKFADNVIQGVQFDADQDRTGYWLFDHHPGDLGYFGGNGGPAKLWNAEHIDHIFEELRPGQVRGVSWLACLMLDIRDLGDLKEAVLMKKKVEACLALLITPGEGNGAPGPFGEKESNPQSPSEPDLETLSPGLVARLKAGDDVKTITPTSTGDGIEFMTKEYAGIGAVTVPYHILTGDPSQANYSSLRALSNGFWPMLDDLQDNVMVPHLMKPAFERRMQALYLRTGDKRFLKVRPEYAMPMRYLNDPIKDLAGEVAEVRAGFKLHGKSLAQRGTTAKKFAAAKSAENKIFDDFGLVNETDPRRVTDSGILQAAAGYIAPTADKKAAKASEKVSA